MGGGTWCHTLRGKAHALKVFKNTSRLLRRVIEHEKDELFGERRKLHNDKLFNLYCSNIIMVIKSRRVRWARNVAQSTQETSR